MEAKNADEDTEWEVEEDQQVWTDNRREKVQEEEAFDSEWDDDDDDDDMDGGHMMPVPDF